MNIAFYWRQQKPPWHRAQSFYSLWCYSSRDGESSGIERERVKWFRGFQPWPIFGAQNAVKIPVRTCSCIKERNNKRCHNYFTIPIHVGSEVLTAVVMKSTIFWDITLCSPLSANLRFGGTYRPHLQGRKISRARNQREIRWQAKGLKVNRRFGGTYRFHLQGRGINRVKNLRESRWQAKGSKVNRCFGGTYRFHLQGRKISWARNMRERKWQGEGLKIKRRFGETYSLHLQGRKISWARNQHETEWVSEWIMTDG
jgi:hypothetical protein